MDPITHAASGAMLAMACRRPRSAWAVPLAALVSASPDLDIFFSATPVGYLLFHRGITHSLAAAPLLGLLAALCMAVYWRRRNGNAWSGDARARDAWSFGQTWALGTVLILLHIWLDCVTTYGTMIFLPFSEYRVRLNGIFIVDFLLVLPLLAGLWHARTRRGLAALLVLWTLAYPAACVGLRAYHEHTAAARLRAEGIAAEQLTVLPDALAPFYWRVLYETDTPYSPPAASTEASTAANTFAAPPTARSVHQQGLDWRGRPSTPVHNYPAASAALLGSFKAASWQADVFFRFTLMPLQEQRVMAATNTAETGGIEYRFYDLRFGTMLPWVERLMQARSGGIPFLLLARRQGTAWTAQRMEFAGAHRSSPWEAPEPPRQPTWTEWLVGWR